MIYGQFYYSSTYRLIKIWSIIEEKEEQFNKSLVEAFYPLPSIGRHSMHPEKLIILS